MVAGTIPAKTSSPGLFSEVSLWLTSAQVHGRPRLPLSVLEESQAWWLMPLILTLGNTGRSQPQGKFYLLSRLKTSSLHKDDILERLKVRTKVTGDKHQRSTPQCQPVLKAYLVNLGEWGR